MHAFAYFNDGIESAAEITLPAISSAALYGRGVFTTVRIHNAKPFLWAQHWRRLTENAGTAGVDLSEFKEEKVKSALAELVCRNGFQKGRARVSFFSQYGGIEFWRTEKDQRTNLLITSADLRPVSSLDMRLALSPYRVNSRSPLAGVKSCNYLENLLALEKAIAEDYNEAIRLNEKNEIVSAATANVFWAKNGELYTPPLETGALRGTTRDLVLENFPVREKLAPLDELLEADEVFLTSAGAGVIRAQSLEEKIFEGREVFLRVSLFFDEFMLEM